MGLKAPEARPIPASGRANRSSGFARGWYSVVPLALGSVTRGLLLTLFAFSPLLITGCHSTVTPKIAATSRTIYPTRPVTPPPAFKLFHQTDNSLTLVTAETATDEQIEAILWQLRDAAHAHTFDALHLPQKFIDARDPIVFIHVYRGAKCASEKYAAKLPCGPSYHAAGEYTLGSFHNPNRDAGALLHDENHQTELWNPDALSAASS